jgi:molecular chaperone DnaK (HSP70)
MSKKYFLKFKLFLSLFFKKLIKYGNDQLQEPTNKVILTYPAYFNENQIEELKKWQKWLKLKVLIFFLNQFQL